MSSRQTQMGQLFISGSWICQNGRMWPSGEVEIKSCPIWVCRLNIPKLYCLSSHKHDKILQKMCETFLDGQFSVHICDIAAFRIAHLSLLRISGLDWAPSSTIGLSQISRLAQHITRPLHLKWISTASPESHRRNFSGQFFFTALRPKFAVESTAAS